MASVFDVAKYILLRQGAMSSMKLQKLCYYAQAWALVWTDNELFPEEFQAWANGPVCYELFDKTRGQFKVSANDEKDGEPDLTDDQKDVINKVLDFYGKRDAQWLSRLSHLEDPWKIARGDTPDGERSGSVISKESMSIYYGGL